MIFRLMLGETGDPVRFTAVSNAGAASAHRSLRPKNA
jgi:hypothetical protein